MNGFVNWYTRNYEAITWFIIGWLSLDLLHEFARGNWIGCLFDIALIWINVHLVRK